MSQQTLATQAVLEHVLAVQVQNSREHATINNGGCVLRIDSRFSEVAARAEPLTLEDIFMSLKGPLRRNSVLRAHLGQHAVDFLEWSVAAFERLLPHVELTQWREGKWDGPKSVWASQQRRGIRVTIVVGDGHSRPFRSIRSLVQRRTVPASVYSTQSVLDTREYDICRRITLRISEILGGSDEHRRHGTSLRAIRDAFDEQIIADHVQGHHELTLDMGDVLRAIHELAEQTYENKALTFGAILDQTLPTSTVSPVFPRGLFQSKKYKALSDGFRTGYRISTDGHLVGFVDLRREATSKLCSKHYYPEWAEDLAKASRNGRCGICLSRQGDILTFDEGTMRFSYRYGRWQYWNHSHLLALIKDRARAQKVAPATVGKVVASVYRAALDVSFRRSGGLFVVLHNRSKLRKVVRKEDELGGKRPTDTDTEFDNLLKNHTIQSLPRSVVVELASLDGGVVLENSGRLLAYGAVLQPARKGQLRGTEGSRTKAAIGASYYGLAVKISSDGDITVYHNGKEFLKV